jgi:methylenetetrahydrofolate dehydrogenase (NADP+)/methenyltetrahydrofolate cyclohydrolase
MLALIQATEARTMAAVLLDGNASSRALRARLATRAKRVAATGAAPGLAVLLLGASPASQVYVRAKVRACAEAGVRSSLIEFEAGAEPRAVLACIEALNEDPAVHGILVQLPLPPQFDLGRIIDAIAPQKDVDGFHPSNLGALIGGGATFQPCTPQGVIALLEAAGVELAGRDAVVVGRSNIVGKPMALMLLERHATVTICTSHTRSLADHTRRADILVVAAGKPGLIRADMVKPGAAVVDVGIHRLADGRLVGDVDFEGVRARAGHISPVPGGVGPMTVTMLLANTVQAAERAQSSKGWAHV